MKTTNDRLAYDSGWKNPCLLELVLSDNKKVKALEEREQGQYLQPKKELSSLIHELSSHFTGLFYTGGTFRPDDMPGF